MDIRNNILETIGHTPLIRLNKLTKDLPCSVLAKVEYFNPGNSIKDRMALKMVEVAEQEGKLQPGGTIIECTSGNTGMGLALAAVVKGYKCIFTTTDKQSKEKIDILKALGAEVIVCPTNVEPKDPRSYYSIARRLAKEIPNSFHANQYDNLANRLAHYETTGPEIWEQTDGKVTHLVVATGTGGTVTGTAMFLKEKNPAIQVWAMDPFGSLLTKYFRTGEIDMNEVHPYISEGIGEDFVPQNYDMKFVDAFQQVSDKDAAVMARRIAREEGLFCGYSADPVNYRSEWIHTPFGPNRHLHDYTGHGPDVWTNQDGWGFFTFGPNFFGSAQNYVAYAPSGVEFRIPIAPKGRKGTGRFTDFSSITVRHT